MEAREPRTYFVLGVVDDIVLGGKEEGGAGKSLEVVNREWNGMGQLKREVAKLRSKNNSHGHNRHRLVQSAFRKFQPTQVHFMTGCDALHLLLQVVLLSHPNCHPSSPSASSQETGRLVVGLRFSRSGPHNSGVRSLGPRVLGYPETIAVVSKDVKE